jgi:hypothetical protein
VSQHIALASGFVLDLSVLMQPLFFICELTTAYNQSIFIRNKHLHQR